MHDQVSNLENNCGTAYDYGTQEAQTSLLKILKVFHKDCVDNDIKYSLNCGTLLGAVRHNGFIPWDDDADVMLSRNDFEKFIRIKNRSADYKIERKWWVYRVKEKSDNTSTSLDLLVVDNVPDNKVLRTIKLFIIRFLQGTMKGRTDYTRFTFFYRICLRTTYLIGLLFSDDTKYKMYNWISKYGNGKATKYVGIYNGLYKELSRLYSPNLMEKVVLHQFEDTELFIISNYDKYLTDVYGDYMTPPSLENRKTGTYDMYCNGEHIVVFSSKHA